MDNRPDPTAIMRLATGYWDSAALLAANELGLFDALGEGPQTAEAIAQQLQAAPRGITLLLNACVAFGLLIKETDQGADRYRNAPDADAFLVTGRPGYLGSAIRWSGDQYAAWGKLTQAARTATPAVPPGLHLGDDPEQTRAFVLGMHNRALGMARGVVRFLDFSGAETLLDVGGGPGTYAMLLAAQYPSLHVTVLDLPGVVAIADELIAEAQADRVTTRSGNAITDDYGTEAFDAVLFSGVLHQMSPATIRSMLDRAHRALKPNGCLAVSDIMLDATKTHPPFAALFSLQMLLTSAEGAVFSDTECVTWLEEADFTDVQAQRLPPPLPYVVVTARKGRA